jgi:hypothetical protein
MNRRSFLTLLASLPLLHWLEPKPRTIVIGTDMAVGRDSTCIVLCGRDADGHYVQEVFECPAGGGHYVSRYSYREPKVLLLPARVDVELCTFEVAVDDERRRA